MADNPNDNLELEDASFDNFEKKKGTLGELWRESPAFKIGVVVTAAALVFGTIILFGGREERVAPSLAPTSSDVSAAPGTQEASKAYVEAVQQENERRKEEAERTGGSALPTPVEPPRGVLTVPEEADAGEDPLQRWRKLQEERIERELQKTQTLAPEPIPEENRQEKVTQLSDKMATQMQSILASKNQLKVSHLALNDIEWLRALKDSQKQKAQAEAQQNNLPSSSSEQPEVIIMPAGQIVYAQTITEANSDAKAPVLAQIAGPPINGARALGEFEVTDNDLLMIKFNTVVIGGVSYDANAIALDPNSTLPAMASDVDHHYLRRIAIPMAAAFVTGLADAVSENGSTSISISGGTGTATSTQDSKNKDQKVATGVNEAGKELQTILDEMKEKTKTTVTLARGTAIGILFLDPILESDVSNGKSGQAFNTPLAGQPYGAGGYYGGVPAYFPAAPTATGAK